MIASHHHSTTADDLEDLYRRQRKRAEQCACGRPGDIYADDGRTPLCGRCWLAIYERDAGDD